MEDLVQEHLDKVCQVIQKVLVDIVERVPLAPGLELEHLHQVQDQEVRKLREEVVQVVDLEVEQELEVNQTQEVRKLQEVQLGQAVKGEALVEVREALILRNLEDDATYGLK